MIFSCDRSKLATGLRILLGIVFVVAGTLKWIDVRLFAEAIESYALLPSILIGPIALVLPVWEIIVGLLLFIGMWKRTAILSALLMCLIFAFALIWAIAHGSEVSCGCFGSYEASRWSAWWALGRDVLLLASAGWLYYDASISK